MGRGLGASRALLTPATDQAPLVSRPRRATRRRRQSEAVIAEAEEEGLPSVAAPRQRRASALPAATPGEQAANPTCFQWLAAAALYPCHQDQLQVPRWQTDPPNSAHHPCSHGAPEQPPQVCRAR